MSGSSPEVLPRLRMRHRLARVLQDAQWWLIGGAAVVAAVLGYVGFRDYLLATAPGTPTFVDLSYRTIQLFTLESGSVEPGRAPATLDVARLLAPLVAAGALVRATLGLFREQVQRVHISLLRDHAVVCGTGRKGLALARSLHERGHRVVAVDQDAESDSLVACRSAGISVLVGDATDPDVLLRAGLTRAAFLVALCGQSGTNAQIATVAHQLTARLPRRRGTSLTCLAHVVEPELSSLLRARFPASDTGVPMRLEFFDVYERAARVLLQRHPAFAVPVDGPQPHVLVVGFGRLGRRVLVQAARTWRVGVPSPGERLRVTVVDRDPAVRLDGLLAEHPEVAEVCDVDLVSELDPAVLASVTAAYVCIGDEAQALLTGLNLHRAVGARDVPVVVRAGTAAGLPALLHSAGVDFAGLHGFAVLDQTCDADLLLGGLIESLAQLLHARYVGAREAQGWRYGVRRDPGRGTHPALTTWEDLGEDLKDSNRDQAAHTWTKLSAVGCELAELTDWEAAQFRFTDDETELLAELEHRRWTDYQTRTSARRSRSTRPPREDLLPWDDLPEQEREIDREFVRALPELLTQLGYQVVRRPS